MATPKKPWHKFSVGDPSDNPRWTEPTCKPFDQVWHVTHISNALTIIPQGTIRPQLIYDKSILNTRRTLVNWVSPNHWSPGYRYGNVAFDFGWSQIIEGRRFYWVEVMEDYHPTACRILLTDNDYDDDPGLRPYDPTLGDGPWWWDDSEHIHYRNSNICLEFMLEFELSVPQCKSINFVKHHDKYCCVDSSFCPDFGLGHQEAAARFLAGLIGEDIDVSAAPIDAKSIRGGWHWLAESWPKNRYSGDVGYGDAAAPALARAVASAYCRRKDQDFLNLAELFYNKAILQASVRDLAHAKFPQINKAEEEII